MEHRTDAELVTRARAGDTAAFAALYDRFAPRIYDLCTHMLHDTDDAADATADVFLAAVEHLEQLVDPAKVKSWLYAIARNEVYRRTRQRSREVALDTDEIERADRSVDDVDGGPAMTVHGDRDLTLALPTMSAALVRDAARGLADRDRLVLEMTLTGGLDGRALGDALGVSVDAAHQASHRMRERLARSVGALLVARKGQTDCPGLQTVLATWDGAFSVLWRKRVARHADRCAVCGARRQSIPQKVLAGTFAAVPFTFLVPPAGLRERVLQATGLRAENPTSPRGARWRRHDGFPHPPDRSRRQVVAAVGVILAVIALGAGGIAVASGDGEASISTPVASGGTSTSSPTTSTTRTGSSAREAPPTTTPTATGPGGVAIAPPATQAPGTMPTQPVVPPTAPAGDTTGPTLSVSLPSFVNSATSSLCSPTPISANAADPSGVSQVSMTFSGASNGSRSMSPVGGGTWTVTWWPPDGAYTVTFTARDNLGNQTSVTRSTTATQCIG
jgi:RNA polymerase sigma factor (sigma-70 family)